MSGNSRDTMTSAPFFFFPFFLSYTDSSFLNKVSFRNVGQTKSQLIIPNVIFYFRGRKYERCLAEE